MEAKGAANTISSPRVTVINQQAATLTLSKSVPWATITYSGNTITTTWAFDSVNISLNVTPTIHEDGSIILDISPTVQQMVGRIPTLYGTSVRALTDLLPRLESLVTRSLLQTDVMGQPIVDTRTLTTRARVNTGDTIVLGGLIQEREHTAETKVPFLGSIPVIKTLFKKNISYSEKSRLFIFLTANIVQ
jgi:type II secretory pathway component GspD/PulD (secretin)